MGIAIPRPAIRKGESRRIVAALAALHERTSYAVRALPNLADHGLYDTLDEARGCVAFDGLSGYQIWRGDVLIEGRGE